jgi:hypothetical protein
MSNQSKTFKVPQSVRDAAECGIVAQQARKEGVESSVRRASSLVQGTVPYRVIKGMLAFFNRHKASKEHQEAPTSAAKISWDLCGGDAGYAWAKRIVKQEEKVEKGSFLAMSLFGDDFPEDEPSVEVEPMIEAEPISSFSALLKAATRKKDYMDTKGRKRIEADADEETDVEESDIELVEAPKDATAPEDKPLTDKELEEAIQEEEDKVDKGVVVIDLVGDDDELPDTDPAPEVPPPLPPRPIPPEPRLMEVDFVPEVIVSPYDHVKIKKIAKKGRNIHGVERKARRQGLYICKGQWAKVDLSLLQGYLSFIDEPGMRKNALAVGGEAMLAVITKAEPKVPPMLLEGLKGIELQKRKQEIQKSIKLNKGAKNVDGQVVDEKTNTGGEAFVARVRAEAGEHGEEEFLRAAAKVSGVSRSILDKVYARGVEAWVTDGRSRSASQESWGRARACSFCTGGTTRNTSDKDLWAEHKR